MKKLKAEIDKLSEAVDERIAAFTWRESIRPTKWKLILRSKVRVYLNRRYGLGRMVEQVNIMRPIKWFNPLNWRWLIPTKVYAMASGRTQRSRIENAD